MPVALCEVLSCISCVIQWLELSIEFKHQVKLTGRNGIITGFPPAIRTIGT